MPHIARLDFTARSQDEALDFVSARYSGFRPERPEASAAAVLQYRSAGSADLAADRFVYSMPGSAVVELREQIAVVTSLRGQLRYESPDRTEVRIGPQDSFLLPIGREVRSTWSEHDVVMLRINPAQVQRVAQERIDSVVAPVRFLDSQPVDEELARFWHSSQLSVSRQLLREPAMEHPLLHQASVDFICSALLTAFPNTASRQHDVAGPDSAAPRSVRQAMAFMDEHPDAPLTITDIAGAAGVTPRALQQGFARHLGMRPMEYLRTVRLERAHLELRSADPQQGATVAAIARRWGFARPERFAALYRKAYGVAPGQTLRSRG